MSSKRKKYLERLLIVAALMGTIVVGGGYIYLYLQARNFYTPQDSLYGVWVEQNVAPYSANTIEIRPDSITIQGHTVTTKYLFNGEVLSFSAGGIRQNYQMLNDKKTEMRLMSPDSYSPTYRLSEKYKNDLR